MGSARRFGQVGFMTQPDKGTAASAPLFTVPLIGGRMGPMKEYGDLPRQGGSMTRLGRYAQRARGEGSLQMLCHPEAIGLLLLHATGNEVSATGTGPTTHIFNMADDYIDNPLSIWSSIGPQASAILGSTWLFTDSWITKLTIEGTSGENVVVTADITSFSYSPVDSPFQVPAVSGTGSSAEDDEPRFKYIGSTVQLSPNNGALEEYTNAERFTFVIDRNPEYRYGPSLTPTVIAPDRLVDMSVGMDFDTDQGGWDFLLEASIGNVTGGGPEQSIAEGKFDVKTGRHPADASRFLQIQSNGRNWEYTTERPDAQPNPGIMEFDLTGICVEPDAAKGGSGTSEAVITLVNDFAGTYPTS